jgi:hypothetical protein
MVQTTGFDVPQKFRPILEFAANDVSYTLQYTMKLYNQDDSSQVIRVATYTSYNPNEWGAYIQPLQLLNEPQPYFIYNKVVAGPTFESGAFTNSVPNVVPFTKTYVPSFFDRFSINVQLDSVIIDANGQLTTDITPSTSLIYGQGDCNIIVNPFDNYFKFTIFTTNGTSTPAPLNLGTNATFYIVFIDNQGNKQRFAAINDATLADPTKGDVLFKVPEADSSSILQYTSTEFYISSMFADGVETQVYQGVFNTPQDIQTVKATVANLQTSQNSAIQTQITAIHTKQQDLIDATNAIKNTSASQQATAIAVKVEIPGLTSAVPTLLKNSVVSNLIPVSEQGKTTSTLATDANLLQQSKNNQASN